MIDKITTLFFMFFLFSNSVYADQKITPLDMELGYWETSIELDGANLFEQMLANVPESQKAAMRQMMEEKMKSSSISKQCITASSFDNMEEKMKGAYASDIQCKFEIEKSTSKILIGKVNCPDHTIKIHTKVINSKQQESEVITFNKETGDSKIKIVNRWKSSTCPAGL